MRARSDCKFPKKLKVPPKKYKKANKKTRIRTRRDEEANVSRDEMGVEIWLLGGN